MPSAKKKLTLEDRVLTWTYKFIIINWSYYNMSSTPQNTTKRPRPLQKLISFTEQDLDMIRSELKDGWRVVSLVATGTRYVGVIEQIDKNISDGSLWIPARKKIKITG